MRPRPTTHTMRAYACTHAMHPYHTPIPHAATPVSMITRCTFILTKSPTHSPLTTAAQMKTSVARRWVRGDDICANTKFNMCRAVVPRSCKLYLYTEVDKSTKKARVMVNFKMRQDLCALVLQELLQNAIGMSQLHLFD